MQTNHRPYNQTVRTRQFVNRRITPRYRNTIHLDTIGRRHNKTLLHRHTQRSLLPVSLHYGERGQHHGQWVVDGHSTRACTQPSTTSPHSGEELRPKRTPYTGCTYSYHTRKSWSLRHTYRTSTVLTGPRVTKTSMVTLKSEHSQSRTFSCRNRQSRTLEVSVTCGPKMIGSY